LKCRASCGMFGWSKSFFTYIFPIVCWTTLSLLPRARNFTCCKGVGSNSQYLVGGFKHVLFSIIYGIILPIDFHIFQDGYCTTNQIPVGRWWQLVTCTMSYFTILHGLFSERSTSWTPGFSLLSQPFDVAMMCRIPMKWMTRTRVSPWVAHSIRCPLQRWLVLSRIFPIWSCPKLGGILKRSKSLDCNIQSHWFWEFPILRSPFPMFFARRVVGASSSRPSPGFLCLRIPWVASATFIAVPWWPARPWWESGMFPKWG